MNEKTDSSGFSLGPKILAAGVVAAGLCLFFLDRNFSAAFNAALLYFILILPALRIPDKRAVTATAAFASLLIVLGYFVASAQPSGYPVVDRLLALAILWTAAWMGGSIKNLRAQTQGLNARPSTPAENRKQELRFQGMCQSSPIGIFQIDSENKYSYVNPAWEKISGVPLSRALGRPWWEVIHEDDREETLRRWAETETEGQLDIDCRVLRPDGDLVWTTLRSRFLYSDEGKEIIGTLSDVTKRVEAQKQSAAMIRELVRLKKALEKTARTDPLTQLPNRRDLEEKLQHETARADRNKRAFSIALADIDFFKKVNDVYGHDAGDHVLVEIAKLLRKNSRKQDVVCRWGGEEFLILLPETPISGAKVWAEKVRSAIEAFTTTHNREEIRVTMSLGISVYKDASKTLKEVIKEADECLYKAKNQGRNLVVSVESEPQDAQKSAP